ncbi:ICP22 family protein [Candidatus Bandiella euplotis]|nr:hypothetical protein [Candidatus Bandiella woodruffii]
MDFTFASGGYFLLRVNGQSAVLNMIESFGEPEQVVVTDQGVLYRRYNISDIQAINIHNRIASGKTSDYDISFIIPQSTLSLNLDLNKFYRNVRAFQYTIDGQLHVFAHDVQGNVFKNFNKVGGSDYVTSYDLISKDGEVQNDLLYFNCKQYRKVSEDDVSIRNTLNQIFQDYDLYVDNLDKDNLNKAIIISKNADGNIRVFGNVKENKQLYTDEKLTYFDEFYDHGYAGTTFAGCPKAKFVKYSDGRIYDNMYNGKINVAKRKQVSDGSDPYFKKADITSASENNRQYGNTFSDSALRAFEHMPKSEYIGHKLGSYFYPLLNYKNSFIDKHDEEIEKITKIFSHATANPFDNLYRGDMTEYFLALQESVVNIRENALKLSKENDLIVHDINDLRSIIDKVIDSSHKKYSEDPYFEAKRAERARIIDGVFNNLVQKKDHSASQQTDINDWPDTYVSINPDNEKIPVEVKSVDKKLIEGLNYYIRTSDKTAITDFVVKQLWNQKRKLDKLDADTKKYHDSVEYIKHGNKLEVTEEDGGDQSREETKSNGANEEDGGDQNREETKSNGANEEDGGDQSREETKSNGANEEDGGDQSREETKSNGANEEDGGDQNREETKSNGANEEDIETITRSQPKAKPFSEITKATRAHNYISDMKVRDERIEVQNKVAERIGISGILGIQLVKSDLYNELSERKRYKENAKSYDELLERKMDKEYIEKLKKNKEYKREFEIKCRVHKEYIEITELTKPTEHYEWASKLLNDFMCDYSLPKDKYNVNYKAVDKDIRALDEIYSLLSKHGYLSATQKHAEQYDGCSVKKVDFNYTPHNLFEKGAIDKYIINPLSKLDVKLDLENNKPVVTKEAQPWFDIKKVTEPIFKLFESRICDLKFNEGASWHSPPETQPEVELLNLRLKQYVSVIRGVEKSVKALAKDVFHKKDKEYIICQDGKLILDEHEGVIEMQSDVANIGSLFVTKSRLDYFANKVADEKAPSLNDRINEFFVDFAYRVSPEAMMDVKRYNPKPLKSLEFQRVDQGVKITAESKEQRIQELKKIGKYFNEQNEKYYSDLYEGYEGTWTDQFISGANAIGNLATMTQTASLGTNLVKAYYVPTANNVINVVTSGAHTASGMLGAPIISVGVQAAVGITSAAHKAFYADFKGALLELGSTTLHVVSAAAPAAILYVNPFIGLTYLAGTSMYVIGQTVYDINHYWRYEFQSEDEKLASAMQWKKIKSFSLWSSNNSYDVELKNSLGKMQIESYSEHRLIKDCESYMNQQYGKSYYEFTVNTEFNEDYVNSCYDLYATSESSSFKYNTHIVAHENSKITERGCDVLATLGKGGLISVCYDSDLDMMYNYFTSCSGSNGSDNCIDSYVVN